MSETKRFKKLGRLEKTKTGDRALYADGSRGADLLPGEIAILVKDTGYFGVCRPVKTRERK